MTFDGKAFGAEIVGIVKGYVEAEIAKMLSRIEVVEEKFNSIPLPRDGKDADLSEVRAIIEETVVELRSSLRDHSPRPELPDVSAMVEDAFTSHMKGKLHDCIIMAVRQAASEIPTPKDGKDGRDGVDGKNGIDGKDGKDGAGLAGAVIDRQGELVITFTNGDVRSLGLVVGKDGADGQPGENGFSLEDFDASLMEDGRTILLSFTRADQSFKVELGIPAMIYRGVWKEGEVHYRGDTVTWAGSLWHCDVQETDEKPDGPLKHWTLAAKRGRDGKDGEFKERRAPQPIRVSPPSSAGA